MPTPKLSIRKPNKEVLAQVTAAALQQTQEMKVAAAGKRNHQAFRFTSSRISAELLKNPEVCARLVDGMVVGRFTTFNHLSPQVQKNVRKIAKIYLRQIAKQTAASNAFDAFNPDNPFSATNSAQAIEQNNIQAAITESVLLEENQNNELQISLSMQDMIDADIIAANEAQAMADNEEQNEEDSHIADTAAAATGVGLAIDDAKADADSLDEHLVKTGEKNFEEVMEPKPGHNKDDKEEEKDLVEKLFHNDKDDDKHDHDNQPSFDDLNSLQDKLNEGFMQDAKEEATMQAGQAETASAGMTLSPSTAAAAAA